MIISSSSAGADAATSAILPPLTSLLPSATNPPKRADLLSLKSRLAALLPPQSGHVYWTALVGFLAGKINRDELGTVIKRVLGVEGEGGTLPARANSGRCDGYIKVSSPRCPCRRRGPSI